MPSKKAIKNIANGPKKSAQGKGKAPLSNSARASQSGRNAARYRECERILTLAGSTSFSVVGNLACNPGLAASFPWLSGHAQLYERYRVHKLIYRYRSLKSATSNGQMLMSFDYDTLDSAPATAVEVSQSTVFEGDRVWENFEMKVPIDPSRVLFTRPGALSNVDYKTYDLGRLFCSAESCDDTTNQGYVEVDYDIELFDKQQGATAASATSGSCALWNLSANQSQSATTVTVAFDEEPVTNSLVLANTAGTFTVPSSGVYRVSVDLGCGTAAMSNWSSIEVDGAAVAPPILFGGVGGGTLNHILSSCLLDLTAGQTIRVRSSGASTSVLAADECRIYVQLLACSV
jgi:hypothetical protein